MGHIFSREKLLEYSGYLIRGFLACVFTFALSHSAHASTWSDYLKKVYSIVKVENNKLNNLHKFNKTARVEILVVLQRTGEVKSVKLTRSAGSNEFDSIAVQSAYNLSLPTPPMSVYFKQYFTPISLSYYFQPYLYVEGVSSNNKEYGNRGVIGGKTLRLVSRIQENLVIREYKLGPVDGLYGNKTKLAIQAFQKDNDLLEDGLPTKELLEFLEKSNLELENEDQKVKDTEILDSVPIAENAAQNELVIGVDKLETAEESTSNNGDGFDENEGDWANLELENEDQKVKDTEILDSVPIAENATQNKLVIDVDKLETVEESIKTIVDGADISPDTQNNNIKCHVISQIIVLEDGSKKNEEVKVCNGNYGWEIVSSKNFHAYIDEDYVCEDLIKIRMQSENIEDFSGDRVELQKFLGAVRLVKKIECPEMENIVIDGEVNGLNIFQAVIPKSNGWEMIILIDPKKELQKQSLENRDIVIAKKRWMCKPLSEGSSWMDRWFSDQRDLLFQFGDLTIPFEHTLKKSIPLLIENSADLVDFRFSLAKRLRLEVEELKKEQIEWKVPDISDLEGSMKILHENCIFDFYDYIAINLGLISPNAINASLVKPNSVKPNSVKPNSDNQETRLERYLSKVNSAKLRLANDQQSYSIPVIDEVIEKERLAKEREKKLLKEKEKNKPPSLTVNRMQITQPIVTAFDSELVRDTVRITGSDFIQYVQNLADCPSFGSCY